MRVIGLSICVLVLATASALAHGDLHLQIEDATKLIAQQPGNADLYLKRGELHRAHQDWDAAQADYDFAFTLKPSLAVIDLARGKMFLEANWPLSALVALDRFLLGHSNHVDGLSTRARTLVKLGRRLEAVRDYSEAINHAAQPGPELFLERSQALTNEGPAFVDQAIKGLDEGITRLGPLPVLLQSAIEMELKQNNFDGALARLERISPQFGSRQETILVRRGEILQQAGRAQEANAAFAAALKALDSLPPSRRQVPAMAELEQRIKLALQSTAEKKTP